MFSFLLAGLALPKWDAAIHGAAALEAEQKIRVTLDAAHKLDSMEWCVCGFACNRHAVCI